MKTLHTYMSHMSIFCVTANSFQANHPEGQLLVPRLVCFECESREDCKTAKADVMNR